MIWALQPSHNKQQTSGLHAAQRHAAPKLPGQPCTCANRKAHSMATTGHGSRCSGVQGLGFTKTGARLHVVRERLGHAAGEQVEDGHGQALGVLHRAAEQRQQPRHQQVAGPLRLAAQRHLRLQLRGRLLADLHVTRVIHQQRKTRWQQPTGCRAALAGESLQLAGCQRSPTRLLGRFARRSHSSLFRCLVLGQHESDETCMAKLFACQ